VGPGPLGLEWLELGLAAGLLALLLRSPDRGVTVPDVRIGGRIRARAVDLVDQRASSLAGADQVRSPVGSGNKARVAADECVNSRGAYAFSPASSERRPKAKGALHRLPRSPQRDPEPDPRTWVDIRRRALDALHRARGTRGSGRVRALRKTPLGGLTTLG